ncbi:hypothetical protein C5B42_00640 [Candidatus Cerribacteria bacterium 'Amazon FNV 2010 28 9']|uniref:Uncharacterized protein n=1 Tax=Candidatus Cerribacteria bacterium 'Amazon FNV 2010 28 9' TaxID=2081795 RepID=A0A317JU43_9BACT|nr:MAG: hypothetical protein C5B42_00640 [Candidatus Cerribacteria bacterium 'Amazon FNV 2010 28 9']
MNEYITYSQPSCSTDLHDADYPALTIEREDGETPYYLHRRVINPEKSLYFFARAVIADTMLTASLPSNMYIDFSNDPPVPMYSTISEE